MSVKTKYLRITMDDGAVFEVPAEIIATNRAMYYSDDKKDIEEFDKEYEYGLSNNYELEDWAKNNMNWDELAPHSKRVKPQAKPDYEELWASADVEVVTR